MEADCRKRRLNKTKPSKTPSWKHGGVFVFEEDDAEGGG